MNSSQKQTCTPSKKADFFFLIFKFFILSMLISGCIHYPRQPEFRWPVKAPFSLSRKFSIYHEGIDFPKKTGEPVLASSNGTIIYAGEQFSGYGKMILIKHSNHWSSLYAHLNEIHVKAGQQVHQGQQIGTVGSTGRSTAPHLHFELIRNKQPVNPLRFIVN